MKNNLFGQVLIIALAIFLVIASIQMLGWGNSIEEIQIDEENLPELPVVPKVADVEGSDVKTDGMDLLNKVNDNPLFSEDRKPFVEPIKTTEELPELVISELKAQLTGVVITPEQTYAMILDTVTNERSTYQVGMPLEGEQGGWTLESIESRKVTLVSDDDKTEELELEVFSGDLGNGKGKGKNKGKNKKNEAEAVTASDDAKQETPDDKRNSAEEIRRKIAERRAQMRANAAKDK